MRLDGIEIKASVVGKVDQALEAPGLEPLAGEARAIYFLEDRTVGAELPLFHHGIVLRARHGEHDDSTIKLRPCRRSQLAPAWLDADDEDRGMELKIEEDWAGDRKALAVSCDNKLNDGLVDAVARGDEPVRRLFDGRQERFLEDCAGTPVNLDALEVLGPIDARRWTGFALAGVEKPVTERWIVDELDFLEVSLRVTEPESAGPTQRALDDALRALSVTTNNRTTKTERVLRRLAGLE